MTSRKLCIYIDIVACILFCVMRWLFRFSELDTRSYFAIYVILRGIYFCALQFYSDEVLLTKEIPFWTVLFAIIWEGIIAFRFPLPTISIYLWIRGDMPSAARCWVIVALSVLSLFIVEFLCLLNDTDKIDCSIFG